LGLALTVARGEPRAAVQRAERFRVVVNSKVASTTTHIIGNVGANLPGGQTGPGEEAGG
jgi:hypothetical protein